MKCFICIFIMVLFPVIGLCQSSENAVVWQEMSDGNGFYAYLSNHRIIRNSNSNLPEAFSILYQQQCERKLEEVKMEILSSFSEEQIEQLLKNLTGFQLQICVDSCGNTAGVDFFIGKKGYLPIDSSKIIQFDRIVLSAQFPSLRQYLNTYNEMNRKGINVSDSAAVSKLSNHNIESLLVVRFSKSDIVNYYEATTGNHQTREAGDNL